MFEELTFKMALSTSHSRFGYCGSDEKSSLPVGDQLQERKSSFGIYTDSDILGWLKGLALDPSDPKASPGSTRQLQKQSLEVRKLLLRGNEVCPRSKRKLDQFLKGSRYVGASGMATKKSDDHRDKRIRTGHSVSCLTNTNENNEIFKPPLVCNSHSSGSLVTIEDEYRLKPAYDLTILDDLKKYGPSCKVYPVSPLIDTNESAHGWTIVDDMEQCGNSRKDFSASPLVDTNESDHGSNKLSPEYSNLTSMNVDDSVNSPDSLSLDECDSELERALRLLISSDDYLPKSIPSAHSSSSLRSSHRNSKAREILTLLFSDGEYYRKSVPIGPDFQAEVPEWTGPVDRKNLYGGDGSEVSRWLGTQMWPIKGIKSAETNTKVIGKGRPDSCSCVSPGCVGCVKHHIDEARLRLQTEIGPAFRCWKFDEMGEFASKSWTLKEQSTFESLVRKNPLSDEASFWKLAFKRFPNKRRKSIVSYYYNVFIPRRMSHQTRSCLDEIDSDDD